jgi:hypothetical protein
MHTAIVQHLEKRIAVFITPTIMLHQFELMPGELQIITQHRQSSATINPLADAICLIG